VCVWGEWGVNERVWACVYICIYNMIHSQLADRRKTGRCIDGAKSGGGGTYTNDVIFDIPSTLWGSIHVHGALFLANLRFCVHYCIDRDTVQKKRTALRAVFLLDCP